MTNISKMLPAMGFVIAAALVALTSAFKEAPKNNNVDQYLYTYNGSNFSQTEIQKSTNYVRSDNSNACTGSTNVCGVFLSTDEGIGNHPDQTEFDNAKSDLWNAQQDPSTASPNVALQP